MTKQSMLVNENLEGGEYSGGLVQRLMLGLHGEWLPCPTSPTVTHTETPGEVDVQDFQEIYYLPTYLLIAIHCFKRQMRTAYKVGNIYFLI